jgi:Uncharacterized conserved protein (DUF2277)
MCRNIKTLHNFDPPVTDEEIQASALQFVRKLSGFTRPSKANERAFNRAVGPGSSRGTWVASCPGHECSLAKSGGRGCEGSSPRG